MKLDLNPVHTFECGQCFRFNTNEKGEYIGISAGRVCRIDTENNLICDDSDLEYWRKFLSLDTDYEKIKYELLIRDDKLKPCIEFGTGIRILKQDIWETIISFIISANNNIPRIKKIIETMCLNFGDEIEFEGNKYYSFPTPQKISGLTREDLAPLRAGYRDKYILDAATKIVSGEVDLEKIVNMNDKDAKNTLMKIKGVGGKVADCIMLFSLGRFSVFPKDVWINRILTEVYDVNPNDADVFVREKYGCFAGYAQQYLYYYFRTTKE